MAVSVRPTNWSFQYLFSEVFGAASTQRRLMKWATDNHLLPKKKVCVCGRIMTLLKQDRIRTGYFACSECGYGKAVRWVRGTIFDPDSALSVRYSEEHIVIVVLGLARYLSVDLAQIEVLHRLNIEPFHVIRFFSFYQQAISEWLYRSLTPPTRQVGGPGTVVQAILTEFPARLKSPSAIQKGTRILALIENGSLGLSIIVYPGLTCNLETFKLLQTRVRRRTTIVIPDAETFAGLDTNRLYNFSGDISLLSRPFKIVMEYGQCSINLPDDVPMGDIVMLHIFGIYCDLAQRDMFHELVKVLGTIYPGN